MDVTGGADGFSQFLAEADEGRGPRVPNGLRVYCAYVLPVIVVVLFVLGLVDKFVK